MKKYIFVAFVLWMLVVLLMAGRSFAADSFSFSESYADKVYCEKDEGELWCDVGFSESYKITAKISLIGIDINQFNGDTYISINLEGFFFEAFLGDDSSYTPGKKSAKFSEEYGPTVSLKWTNKQLTITINCKHTSDTIMAGDYVGQESGPIDATASAHIEFADASIDFDVAVTGKVTTKTVRKGEDEFEVSTISLKGKGTPVE